MRQLETKKRKQAREQRNKTILGLFIAAIMVFSGVGYALWQREPADGNENIVEYNNHTFIRTEKGWQTEVTVNNKNFILESFYLPKDLENITVQNNPSFFDFNNKVIYIAADDDKEKQAAYILNTALNQFSQRIQLACSEQEANETFCLENNLPIKSCESADFNTAIIIIEKQETQENETSENLTTINYKESCLIIKGKNSELLKAAEKAVFIIFEVM